MLKCFKVAWGGRGKREIVPLLIRFPKGLNNTVQISCMSGTGRPTDVSCHFLLLKMLTNSKLEVEAALRIKVRSLKCSMSVSNNVFNSFTKCLPL